MVCVIHHLQETIAHILYYHSSRGSFGCLHYGANYMFYDGFSSAVGTLILSKFLAQTVYDENIAESHGDPGGAPTDAVNFKCYGTECFRITHVIVSFLSLTCIALSAGLVWSTRDVYQRH